MRFNEILYNQLEINDDVIEEYIRSLEEDEIRIEDCTVDDFLNFLKENYYVEDFVEHTGDVEAQAALLEELAVLVAAQILVGEPAHCGEGVFEFVAVVIYFLGPDDGLQFRALELAEVTEVVLHLFLLEFQLFFVVEHLPFAAAAHAEVPAGGCHPVGGGGADGQQVGLGIAVFAFVNLHVHEIAGHGVGHEDGEAVLFGHGLALRSRGENFQVFYVVSFECHNLCSFGNPPPQRLRLVGIYLALAPTGPFNVYRLILHS